MRVDYGGIDLSVTRLLECLRRDVYDQSNQDYLYSVWRLVVEAIYSPQTLSGQLTPYHVSASSQGIGDNRQPDPTRPSQAYRNSPPYTDVALRHALMQPRQRLYVWYNSSLVENDPDPRQLWIVAPADGCPCDPINGPHPVECSPDQQYGDGKTWLVRWAVEFATRDCGWGGTPTSMLISNQWTASETYDEDYRSTRTVAGEAVFRADLLKKSVFQPDAFRAYLLPPPPPKCKRLVDEVTVLPDGVTVRYQVRDVTNAIQYIDQPTDAKSGQAITGRRKRNVTRVNARVVKQFRQPGQEELLDQMVASVRDVMWGIGNLSAVAGRVVGGENVGFLPGAFLAAGELGVGLGAAALQTLNRAMPKYTERAEVEVFGNELASQGDLQYLAYAIAFGQLTGSSNVLRRDPAQWLTAAARAAIRLGGLGAGGIFGVRIPGVAISPAAILAGALDAGARQVANWVAPIFTAIPPAHEITLEYDPFNKRVAVVVEQSYTGLIDMVNGNTVGGRWSMLQRLPDEVVGGDWPSYFNLNASYLTHFWPAEVAVGGSLPGALPPRLPDAFNLIGTNGYAPPIAPPVDGVGRGISLADLVTADLLSPCSLPTRPLVPAVGGFDVLGIGRGRRGPDSDLLAEGYPQSVTVRGPIIDVAKALAYLPTI